MLSRAFAWSILLSTSTLVSAWVEFDPALIPVVKDPLPLLTLGTPGSFSPDLLQEFVHTAAPGVTLQPNETVGPGVYAYEGDRLVAIVENGEAQIFANLETLRPANGSIAINRAWSYLSLGDTFPLDHTNITIVPGSELMGTRINLPEEDQPSKRQDMTPPPETFLAHAIVQRSVVNNGISYPVCGPGTRASFGFNGDGSVNTLSYRWNRATLSGTTTKSNETNKVFESIIAELEPLGQESGLVKVEGVDVCIYDSGVTHMQPVYRFWGIVNAHPTPNFNETASLTRFVGYLTIGPNGPELVPSVHDPGDQTPPVLNGLSTRSPSVTNYFDSAKRSSFERRAPKPTVRYGRYVIQHDVDQWVKNANDFKNNIQQTVANFIDAQYYWAEQYMFQGSKNSWVNSVHLAETEAHGNWWRFRTNSVPCCERVYIDNIPDDGYGPGAGGTLAYWVIHACEVIPTSADFTPDEKHNAYDKWWHVFNGLHAIASYRTEMYIGDHAMPRIAKAISLGSAFVSSWLQIVHDDEIYSGNPMYFDDNVSKNQPLGRPSAVVVCGHETDRVWQVENLGRPTCLREFWYTN